MSAVLKTCPSWCSRDHGAAELQIRTMFDGTEPRGAVTVSEQAELDIELAHSRDWHQHVVGTGQWCVLIETDPNGPGASALSPMSVEPRAWVSQPENLTLAEVRELAANLAEAAKLMEQVATA